MNLTQTEEYAIRAVVYIAANDPKPVRASALASTLELPRNYLGKTLTELAHAGVLSSARGVSGGFRMARAASEVSLADVIRPFRAEAPRRCLVGLGQCGEHPDCPVHRRWLPAATMVDRFFDATTIDDLVATTRGPALDVVPSIPAP